MKVLTPFCGEFQCLHDISRCLVVYVTIQQIDRCNFMYGTMRFRQDCNCMYMYVTMHFRQGWN